MPLREPHRCHWPVSALMALTLASPYRPAPSAEPYDAPRLVVCLNGEWDSCESRDPDHVPEADWRRVRVPVAEADGFSAGGRWYRLRFGVPAGFKSASRAVYLRFMRVVHYARVKLNGAVVGENYGFRTPFELDVSDAVKYGQPNVLEVFAHLAEGKFVRPGAGVEDPAIARAYSRVNVRGGVSGDVFIGYRPRLRVTDVYVTTSVRKKTITVTTRIRNDGPAEARVSLRSVVKRRGKEVLTLSAAPVKVTLAPGQARELQESTDWPDPELWGFGKYGKPVLYFLRSVLTRDERRVDERSTRFGFREFRVDVRGFYLNEQRIFLVGGLTASPHPERQRLTHWFAAAQSANQNVYQYHRDEAAQDVYDLADELGMLLIPQLVCTGPKPPTRMDAAWTGRMAATYKRWVTLNRNHPSVIMWGPHCILPKGAKWADRETLWNVIARTDPSRPVVLKDVAYADGGLVGLIQKPNQFKRNMQKFVERAAARKQPLFVGEIWAGNSQHKVRGMPPLYRYVHDEMKAQGMLLNWGVAGLLAGWSKPFRVSWPSHSGRGARPRPFGGTLPGGVNWCDPEVPLYYPTPQVELFRRLYRELEGEDHGGVAKVRVPEVIVTATAGGRPASGKFVYLLPAGGQTVPPAGVMADAAGKAWFVLREPGKYRAVLPSLGPAVEFMAKRQPISPTPGYEHVQRVTLGGEIGKATADVGGSRKE